MINANRSPRCLRIKENGLAPTSKQMTHTEIELEAQKRDINRKFSFSIILFNFNIRIVHSSVAFAAICFEILILHVPFVLFISALMRKMLS